MWFSFRRVTPETIGDRARLPLADGRPMTSFRLPHPARHAPTVRRRFFRVHAPNGSKAGRVVIQRRDGSAATGPCPLQPTEPHDTVTPCARCRLARRRPPDARGALGPHRTCSGAVLGSKLLLIATFSEAR